MAETRYHMTPDGPKLCPAKIQCRLTKNGTVEVAHYTDLAKANADYALILEEKHKNDPLSQLKKDSIEKPKSRKRKGTYATRDWSKADSWDTIEPLIRRRLMNELPNKTVKAAKITDYTKVTVCFGDKSWTSGLNVDSSQHVFLYGMCSMLAYENSKRLGNLPVVRFDDDSSDLWSGHAGVLLENGEILDVAGTKSIEDVYREYPNVSSHSMMDPESFRESVGIDYAFENLGELEKSMLSRISGELIQSNVNPDYPYEPSPTQNSWERVL